MQHLIWLSTTPLCENEEIVQLFQKKKKNITESSTTFI